MPFREEALGVGGCWEMSKQDLRNRRKDERDAQDDLYVLLSSRTRLASPLQKP